MYELIEWYLAFTVLAILVSAIFIELSCVLINKYISSITDGDFDKNPLFMSIINWLGVKEDYYVVFMFASVFSAIIVTINKFSLNTNLLQVLTMTTDKVHWIGSIALVVIIAGLSHKFLKNSYKFYKRVKDKLD